MPMSSPAALGLTGSTSTWEISSFPSDKWIKSSAVAVVSRSSITFAVTFTRAMLDSPKLKTEQIKLPNLIKRKWNKPIPITYKLCEAKSEAPQSFQLMITQHVSASNTQQRFANHRMCENDASPCRCLPPSLLRDTVSSKVCRQGSMALELHGTRNTKI